MMRRHKTTKGYRMHKKRNKGMYIDFTRTNVNVTKESKPASAYEKLSGFVKKHSPAAKKGIKAVKSYVQGTNDGLDKALGIPQKEKDFVMVTKVPRGYRLVKKRDIRRRR